MGRLERHIDPQALETARAKAKPHVHVSAGATPTRGDPLPAKPDKPMPRAYLDRRKEKVRRAERRRRREGEPLAPAPPKKRDPCFVIALGLNRYDIRERKPRLKPRKPAKTYKPNGKRERARRRAPSETFALAAE